MSEIQNMIEFKNQQLNKINLQIEKEKNDNTKAIMLKNKEIILEEKNKLINLLIQFNDLKDNNVISEIKPIKRKIDIFENDVEFNKLNEDVLIKKGPNGEITYKTIKKNNNDSPEKNESNKDDSKNNNEIIKKYNNNDNNLVSKKPSKSMNKNKNLKNKQIKQLTNRLLPNIKNNKIIETIFIGKNIDFNKNNYNYSWKKKDFITTFTKKF